MSQKQSRDIKLESDEGEQKTADKGKSATVTNIAPDTGLPMDVKTKIRFGIGFVLFSLMWMAAGTAASAVLLPQHFNDIHIGVPEVILGSMNSVGSIFALVSNIVFGALSDMTRSRFGKRTPWIVLGGFIAALGYVLSFTGTSLFAIVAGWSIVQIGVNCMIAPTAATLSDRIPSSIRGTISAFYGGAQTVGSSIGTLMGAQFINNMSPGIVLGAAVMAFTGLLAIMIWPRELSNKDDSVTERRSAKSILKAFIPPTRNCRDYYLALIGRLTLIIGWTMIQGYQLYILQKYCGLNKADAASTISKMSIILTVILICTSVVAGPISDRLQRRKVIVAIGAVFLSIGIMIPWFMPNATGMILFAIVGGLGHGIYISVDQSLNIDVLPDPNQAGKDLGILNFANTVGSALSPAIVSFIVVKSGSYNVLFPIAATCVFVGAIIIMLIRKVK